MFNKYYCLLYKTASVRRLTVTVNLGVVCICMRREMMFNKLQQVGSVKEKQDRSTPKRTADGTELDVVV